MALSYNGWAASPTPSSIGIVRFEPIKGHPFPAGVKGGDVAVVFTYLVINLDKRVEPIEEYKPGDEWGYAYRANRNNPNQLSCHASGTAIDYNATQHPNKVLYTWTRDQTREIHKILDELGGVVKWLEGWDEMHFEIRGTAAQVKFVADKIREKEAQPAPTIPQEDEVLKIIWVKGDPTTPGDDPDVTAAYIVSAVKNSGGREIAWGQATWIPNPTELARLKTTGFTEFNTVDKPVALAGTISKNVNFLDGPFKGA